MVEPEQFIRGPYVLDFLDLKDYPALREPAVEPQWGSRALI